MVVDIRVIHTDIIRAEEAVRIASEIGEREVYTQLLTNLGEIHIDIKAFEKARTHLNEAAELCRAMQDRLTESTVSQLGLSAAG